MNDTRNIKRDKKQHVQVFVRVRPINSAERAGKSSSVVEVSSNKEVIVHEKPHDKYSKKFTFDKVFGPLSKQIDVYNAVVSPLLEEVLAGYNCTVFAYGQTGTGKTFTMEGADNDPANHWQADTPAGIIPRSLSHLFDELRTLEGQEYTVRVSFLELYNEEIFDLLTPTDDVSKIRLYDDSTKKGAVIVHGLEEVTVHNKSEVYKILEKGSEKRQTAATLMNAHSSRSHTVFSITIHIKENTIDGEELLKTGKLNLVDLAGSENIGRSGAVDRRAREAGNINQSLLTLGRVITALVERTPHVPYRESKLTRLLQESLGGRTKTSIIATVSPAGVNLEETLSTLDYAHRAKNITNRPEINQKLSKKALLQEYTEEIERLRRDLLATRERNGVYLAQDNYNEMQTLISHQAKEIEEKLNHIKAIQDAMEAKEQVFNDLQLKHSEQAMELRNTEEELKSVADALKSTTARLEIVEQEKDEQKCLLEKHVSTENVLFSQAKSLLDVTTVATTDVSKLHEKVFRKKQLEERNMHLQQQFRNDTARRVQSIENDVSTQVQDLTQFFTSLKSQIDAQTVSHSKSIDQSVQGISEKLVNPEEVASNRLTSNVNGSYSRYQKWLENEIQNATTATERECRILNDISSKLAPKIQRLIENKIAENLRALNEEISTKIENLSSYTANTITTVNNYGLGERDRLCSSIDEVKENIGSLLQNQKDMMEKRQNFAKVMEDVHSRFDDLNVEEDKNHSRTFDVLNRMNDVCHTIKNQTVETYETNIDKERDLQSRMQSDMQNAKSNIANETEKCWRLAETAIDESRTLLDKFQADLSESCDRLTSYKNSVESSVTELQQKMQDDKDTATVTINDMHSMVRNASIEQAKFVESQKVLYANASAEVGHKLINESTNAMNLNNRITTKLQRICDRVDKFLADDLQRDVPTGSTPAKREFQYPRGLVTTSPHERIIRRFREARKNVTEEDEEIPILNNNTPVKQSSGAN